MRKLSRALGALAVAAVAIVARTGPSGAVVPPGQVVITAVGADATYQAMNGILDGTNQYNVPSIPEAPFFAEGDANCPDLQWVSGTPGAGQMLAPISAANGLNALKALQTGPANQKGCIDIGRASNAPRGIALDGATFEYYAFALDAVSWASPSLAAPATLTKQQIKDIYACNIKDWSELPGGGSGPIQRYFTQVGSGTGSFFQSDILDGQDPLVDVSGCSPTKRMLQSQAVAMDPQDRDSAIMPYSVGAWIFQTNNRVNPTLDVRNGVKLGGITTTGSPVIKANAAAWNSADEVYQPNATVVAEGNTKVNNPTPPFPGVRYMYNVVDTVSPNYAEAAALVAFVNAPSGAKSTLCSGGEVSAILSVGFQGLSSSAGGSTNLAGATCRKYTN
jgi:ABC-type phosphate transport system substrate-binding protein